MPPGHREFESTPRRTASVVGALAALVGFVLASRGVLAMRDFGRRHGAWNDAEFAWALVHREGPAPLAVREPAPPSTTAPIANVTPPRAPRDPSAPRVANVTTPFAPCRGSYQLTGVLVADDANRSFVLATIPPSTTAIPYRRGDALGPGTVARIGWQPEHGGFALVAMRSGRGCYIAEHMPRELPGDAASDSPSDSPSGGSPHSNTPATNSAVIHSPPDGSTEVTLERSFVARLAENPMELMQSARMTPRMAGGRMAGVELSSLRPGSFLARIGLRDGDELQAIDGQDLSRPDRLLELLTRIGTIDHSVLSIARAGRTFNVDVTVR